MNIKHTIEDGIERAGAKLDATWRQYDRNHSRPNAIDYGVTGVLSSVVAVSEVGAHKLSSRPKTVPRVMAQVGLHGLAAGATFVAGMLHENAAAQGAKNK